MTGEPERRFERPDCEGLALARARLLEDAVAMTPTEMLTLGEAGRIAEPFLADPANEAHLVRLLDELRRIEGDARTAGRW